MARIVVDAMGGDLAPGVNLKGALSALGESPDLSVILVGDKPLIEDGLKGYDSAQYLSTGRLQIVAAQETISMEDHGAAVIRKKKNSSINVGLRLVRDGNAEAFVSAGNSGAVMTGALLVLGRLADVERPAILIKLPTADGHVIILDGGANVDCRASHLVQFAEMGHVYASIIDGVEKPKIALLSNGSEAHKGNELTREAHDLLKARKDIRFVGYAEGYDVYGGLADVIICDGFVGNVVLKLSEGLADMAFAWFRSEIKRDIMGLVGMAFMRGLLQKFRRKFDYEPYGAAPLVGVNGMVLIGHGKSTEVAIRNGILTANRGVQEKFNDRISEHLERHRKASSTDKVQ